MAFFHGRSDNLLDGKNRVVLPVKFREQLGDKIWVMPGLDGNISIYDEDGFKNKLREIKSIPNPMKRNKVISYFINHMDILEFDNSNGRVLISPYLKEHAALTKEIVIVGQIDWIEIWDAERFAESRRTSVSTEAVAVIVNENAERVCEDVGSEYDGF